MKTNRDQTISTTSISVNGRVRVRATGLGKQRTIDYNMGRTIEQNQADAAGALGLVLGWQATDDLTYMGFADGSAKFVRHMSLMGE